MIKKILKLICWPFKKFLDWLKSGLPEGKKRWLLEDELENGLLDLSEDCGGDCFLMTKCKKCHHDCHCDGDLHSDEYGLCACEDCACKRTYEKEKDHGNDMSYENEIKYDG